MGLIKRKVWLLCTGAYDCIRHLHLRQNYSTVWVSESNEVFDGHKHWMIGGFSEHAEFVKSLLQRGSSQPIPVGVSLSAAKKRAKKQATPKRSARLKSMLRAPEAESSCNPSPGCQVVLSADTQEYLPGALVQGKDLPILDSVGQETQSSCMAATNKGERCKRGRTHGSFCFHHYGIASSQKFALSLFGDVVEPARSAMQRWEKELLDLAIARTLQENEELRQRMERSLGQIDRRLAEMKLRRVPVPPYGNCQFEAIKVTAQLPIGVSDLRMSIVQYLRPLSRFFAERMEGQFKGRYEAYCQNLEKDGTWGDELSLLGAAHLLRRPVVLVTDSSDNEAYCRDINPPNIIAKSLWGPPIWLACCLDRHFDATEPVP
jgi:hypothetical protein